MSGTDVPLSDDLTRVHLDTTKPSLARCYDAALGGKDNYEVDREFIRRLERVTPEIGQFTWDNRNFLIRVTRFLAGEVGITQFLDCGSGLPTAENTHQVAQRIQPEARVVYIDNDPVVLAHGRALLKENDRTHFSAADIFKPHQIINNGIVQRYLDFSEPIALFQLGTLHHYDGERSPQSIMAESSMPCPPAHMWRSATSSIPRPAVSSASSPARWNRSSCTARWAAAGSFPCRDRGNVSRAWNWSSLA